MKLSIITHKNDKDIKAQYPMTADRVHGAVVKDVIDFLRTGNDDYWPQAMGELAVYAMNGDTASFIDVWNAHSYFKIEVDDFDFEDDATYKLDDQAPRAVPKAWIEEIRKYKEE